VPSESALLFIDLQNYNCSRRGALYTTPGKEVLNCLKFCLLVYLCCFFCASTKLPLGYSPFSGKHILPTRLMQVGPFRLARQPGLNAVHTCSSKLLLAQASSEEYWWREVAAATPRWMRLRNECKRAGIEVVYTVFTYLRPSQTDS